MTSDNNCRAARETVLHNKDARWQRLTDATTDARGQRTDRRTSVCLWVTSSMRVASRRRSASPIYAHLPPLSAISGRHVIGVRRARKLIAHPPIASRDEGNNTRDLTKRRSTACRARDRDDVRAPSGYLRVGRARGEKGFVPPKRNSRTTRTDTRGRTRYRRNSGGTVPSRRHTHLFSRSRPFFTRRRDGDL